MLAALREGEPETGEHRWIETGVGAGHGGDTFDSFVVIDVTLRYHIDEAFAAGEVEPLSWRIIEEIVRVAGARQVRHNRGRGRVEDDQTGGFERRFCLLPLVVSR